MTVQVPGVGETPPPESCPTCGKAYEPKTKWNGGDPRVFWFPTCTCEEDATEKWLDERWGPVGEPPPDPVLASQGWPFYEARLSVHVRESKPTDTFGEGGEELAHARAWTQAPDFSSAVDRLDGDLAKNWTQITTNAALVDVPPSPDVLPPDPGFFSRTSSVPQWVLVLNLVLWVAFVLSVIL